MLRPSVKLTFKSYYSLASSVRTNVTKHSTAAATRQLLVSIHLLNFALNTYLYEANPL